MPVLRFSLTPEATGRVYELLICLAKFGETVALEARNEKLTLTALNSSKTAYASFALDAKTFFIDYHFDNRLLAQGGERFTCHILNKALQSVFKGRSTEARGREVPVERCDVHVQDQPDQTECRLIIKMISKHGMTKTYRLTYESVEIMHAFFDKTAATQGWQISARILREYIEFFGPKTEQLDLVAQDGKAIFTSFTEKIQDGKEVLKQPLETAIAIHTEDFEDFHMQESMHIVISVRDFRAIVTHAETVRGSISAHFSFPARPLQFSYRGIGLHCEFTLMTTGDMKSVASMQQPTFISTRRSTPANSAQAEARMSSGMPPPALPGAGRPFSSQSQRPSLREQIDARSNAAANPEIETLFVPNDSGGEDERPWDPANFEQEQDDEMLGWDASMDDLTTKNRPTFRDSGTTVRAPNPRVHTGHQNMDSGLEPTQRLSQLQGMFD